MRVNAGFKELILLDNISFIALDFTRLVCFNTASLWALFEAPSPPEVFRFLSLSETDGNTPSGKFFLGICEDGSVFLYVVRLSFA